MRIKPVFWRVVGFFLAAQVIPAQAQQPLRTYDPCVQNGAVVSTGDCWRTLSQRDQQMVVRGVWTGVGGQSSNSRAGGGSPIELLSRDYLQIPSSTTIGDLIGYINQLYATPANRNLSWEAAYILAAMRFRDDDSDDEENLIRFLRRYPERADGGRDCSRYHPHCGRRSAQ